MLTKDLLRFSERDGRIVPRWLKPTPAVVELATNLIAHWRDGIGQRRGELEDAAAPILHQSRSLPVARGLQKLILDHCTFTDPASCSELRAKAFALSAAQLRAPPASSDQHRAQIAAQLDCDVATFSEQLYADLPDQASLTAIPALEPRALLNEYNLSLAQGLLLRARALRVVVHDADLGLRRRLLKALRWRRLLARVTGDDGSALQLEVSGPDAVIDQGTRYGLNLALWLPALACAKEWEASCDIPFDRTGRPAVLTLSQADGLVGDSNFLGYVPETLRDLEVRLAEKCPDWHFEEPQLVPLADGEIVVPDLQIRCEDQTFRIELFHRWHASALQRRLKQVAHLPAKTLLLGVDRSLAKTTAIAPIVATNAFLKRGFIFSDMPTPQVLRKTLTAAIAGTLGR
jgi:uncharacterized protein